MCSKLTIKIKTPTTTWWRRSGFFIINFKHIFWWIYCWLWINNLLAGLLLRYSYQFSYRRLRAIKSLWGVGGRMVIFVTNCYEFFLEGEAKLFPPYVTENFEQRHIACGGERCWKSKTTSNCCHATTRGPLCFCRCKKWNRWILDDIKYDSIEDVPVVKDPDVGIRLLDTTKENVDDARDR